MKKTLLLLLIVSTSCFSQITNEGEPYSWKNLKSNPDILPNQLPEFDLKMLQEEDKINDLRNDVPWRFGYMHSVNYGFEHGQWVTLENGDRIWRILITSPEALSLNVIFDDYYLPEGSTVYLYNQEKTDLLGAYTAQQNQESGILGTWLVKGDALWIEYYEPYKVTGQGRLHIAKATHGYRNAETFNLTRGLNNSGHCNLDVDCSIGSDWQIHKDHNKNSVGLLLTGSSICTGALVNNTSNDGTPYFLTSNHCYSNPEAWSFRFGWISPNPVCAAEENSTDSETNMTISGATLRAKNEASDFCLVEINNAIPNDWESVWVGWDKTDNFPLFQVGIHHPSADIMKVCRDDDPAIKEINDSTETWEITGGSNGGWELGATEGGSLGSPLFDQDGKLIGQLSGGTASCSGTNDNGEYNFYGRFGMSWDTGTTPETRLRDWLDPTGLDPDTLDSYPPVENYALDGAVIVNIISGNCANTEVTSTIELINYGSDLITSATIEWVLNEGSTHVINFNGNLSQYESEFFSIGPFFPSLGMHEINANLTSVNGGADDNIDNNAVTESFEVFDLVMYDTSQVHLELLTDDYAEETSWEFKDSEGTILYSYGPYADEEDNTLFNYSFDVVFGECYSFEIFDAYGDGICCGFGTGYFILTTDDSTVIYEGGEFDFEELVEDIGVDEPLSKNDFLAQNIIIFPNPTKDLINIKIIEGQEEYHYSITNVLGQVIQEGVLINTMNTILLNEYNSGLYFVKIQDQATNNQMVSKLIIE